MRPDPAVAPGPAPAPPRRSRAAPQAGGTPAARTGWRAILCTTLLSGAVLWPDQTGAQGPARPLRLGVELRFEADTNPGLTSPSAGLRGGTLARLNFGWVTETGIDRLSIDAGLGLQGFAGPGAPPASGMGITVEAPQVALGYTRSGADGSLALTARWREDSIRRLRGLDALVDPETGDIILPEDFEALTGTGTRRSGSVDARLRLGESAPVGIVLGAGATVIDYAGNAPGLTPSTRLRADATVRLRLNEVAAVSVGVRTARFTPQGGAGRVSTGVSLGFAQDLPAGQFGIDLAADTRPEGTRLSASMRRRFEGPLGALGLGIGVARPAGSTRLGLTGSLDWRQELPNGSLAARAQMAVAAGADDIDRRVTTLSLDWNHRIGSAGTLSAGGRLAVSDGGASRVTSAALSASYTHALTEDLGLVLGYTHRLRQQTPGARAAGNTVFLTLRRNWN